jgi:hypothetical protein
MYGRTSCKPLNLKKFREISLLSPATFFRRHVLLWRNKKLARRSLQMIEIDKNRMILLSKAAVLLPIRNEKKVHPSTLHRWRSRGVRGIRLACNRIGNCWFTTQKALEEFSAKLSATPESKPKPKVDPKLIDQELEKHGF